MMPTSAQIFQSIWWSQRKIQTNNTGKGIHHDVLHKTTRNILCGLSLLKKGNNKIQISERLPYKFQQNLWKDLWDTWSTLFMALSKLGFTMYQQAVLQKNLTIFYGSLS